MTALPGRRRWRSSCRQAAWRWGPPSLLRSPRAAARRCACALGSGWSAWRWWAATACAAPWRRRRGGLRPTTAARAPSGEHCSRPGLGLLAVWASSCLLGPAPRLLVALLSARAGGSVGPRRRERAALACSPRQPLQGRGALPGRHPRRAAGRMHPAGLGPGRTSGHLSRFGCAARCPDRPRARGCALWGCLLLSASQDPGSC